MDTLLDQRDQTQITYAPFWKRAVALLIDSVIVTVGYFVIGFVVAMVLGAKFNEDHLVLAQLLAFIFAWLYFAIFESSVYRATPGKMIMKLQVLDVSNYPIEFSPATKRYFRKYLSSVILGIGYLVALFTKQNQTMHDLMADTIVIEKAD